MSTRLATRAGRLSSYFEPALREGDTRTLLGAGLPRQGLNIRCKAVTALPEYMYNFGALTAGIWVHDLRVVNLELNFLELGQLRMRVVDDCRLRLKHSPSVQQWRTRRGTFYLPQFPPSDQESLQHWCWVTSEFFIWEDYTPAFSVYSSRTSTASRVLFSGWKFGVERISEPGRPIVTSDWPSRLP